jgi:acyl-CoA dehydrogenase
MDFAPSARSDALRAELVEFDENTVRPALPIYNAQREASGDPHFPPPVMEELKTEARKRGLWNIFMPEGEYGLQLSNLDYAPLCEVMGGSPLLSEATNCSAPDTGNMEILVQFGTALQQDQWLQPLLNGEIRSCFAMTEPWVAPSDALNISSRITRDGNDYVIQGHKWFTSGALDPRCKVAIFMGVTDPDADPYHRQSMILVPMDAPVTVAGLPVFGHPKAAVTARRSGTTSVSPGVPARRRRQWLRDRAGPRPRPDPSLHARHRSRRTRARPDVHARADACRLR